MLAIALVALSACPNQVLSTSSEDTGSPTVDTPAICPTPGAYFTSQTVTISDSTPESTIYYTTDGTAPTTSSTSSASAIFYSVDIDG
ncbi:MAG TPA: chitobiase/beta-hexosaminidase C-terminal domain-containing protein, partial [Spirochaetia bacterium]